MTLTAPFPFRDAIQEIARRGILPTSLGSAEIEALGEGFARDSFFAAKLMIESPLEEFKRSIEQILTVGSGLGRAEARLNVRRQLEAAGVNGDAASNDLTDLASDARINLVINHWTKYARARGQTIRNNDGDLLWSHPCYELVRIGDREQKRQWIERWRGAGGRVFAGRPAGMSLNPELMEGRCIAKKDDTIWFKLSRFNRAEPPYDFQSGVGRAAVPRAVCVALGVIEAGERTGPTPLTSPFPDPEENN